jgi:hypothetical protein
MKLIFCTLLDTETLSRGLSTYRSLVNVCKEFNLYAFTLDDESYNALNALNLEHLIPISLSYSEDSNFLSITNFQTKQEYIQRCISSSILYVFENFECNHCTYLDPNLWFYEDPITVINEIPIHKNVMIVENRFTKHYFKSESNSRFNSSFIYFDASEYSMEILETWQRDCIEMTEKSEKKSKIDLKYMDDWTEKYDCVHIMQNIGGGLASWNIQRYNFDIENGRIKGLALEKNIFFNPIFFHFQGLNLYENNKYILAPKLYIISQQIQNIFYMPYIQQLFYASEELSKLGIDFDSNGTLSNEQYNIDKHKGYSTFFITNFVSKYLNVSLVK